MAHLFIRETKKARFPGYILIRRVDDNFDVNRLFDLKGCGAIVTIAGCIAKIPDYEVEIMRRAEYEGIYDAHVVQSPGRYKLTPLADDGLQQWTGQSRALSRLDESGKTSHFVDAVGRVAHIIARADAQ